VAPACAPLAWARVGRDPKLTSGWTNHWGQATRRAAHNQVIFQILGTLQQVVREWMDKVTKEFFEGDSWPAFAEHAAISEEIPARNEQQVRHIMGAHLDRGGARLLAVLEKNRIKDR